MFALRIGVPSLFLLQSCVNMPEQYPSTLKERATLAFEYESKRLVGVGVLKRKSSHNIRFVLPEKTKEFVISTCHREEYFKLNSTRFFDYTYVPVAFLENWDSCFLVASAHTSDGKKEFALIDFSSNETLQASLYCSGKKTTGTTTFCQGRAGTTQMLSSQVRVSAKSASCDVPKTQHGANQGYRFFIDVKKGYCIYAFNQGFKVHRLTIYGY